LQVKKLTNFSPSTKLTIRSELSTWEPPGSRYLTIIQGFSESTYLLSQFDCVFVGDRQPQKRFQIRLIINFQTKYRFSVPILGWLLVSRLLRKRTSSGMWLMPGGTVLPLTGKKQGAAAKGMSEETMKAKSKPTWTKHRLSGVR